MNPIQSDKNYLRRQVISDNASFLVSVGACKAEKVATDTHFKINTMKSSDK